MKITINSVHFKVDKKLDTFIREKLTKLGGLHDGVLLTDVSLKVENTDKPENKITEIKVTIPGNEFYAKKQCQTFEEATDLVVDALRKQLIKHKEKIRRK